MFKKFLSVMLLAVGIIFGSQLATMEKVSAAEVYAYSHKGIDYYVTGVENLKEGQFKVLVRCKTGNNVVRNEVHFYTRQGDRWFVEIHDGAPSPLMGYVMSGSPTKIIYDIAKGGKWDATVKSEKTAPIFNKHIETGDKFYSVKNYDGARNAYAEARKIDSSKIENYCNELIKKGNSLSEEKNFAAATDYYRKAIVMGSKNAAEGLYTSLVETGSAARANKKFDDAIRLLNEAINFLPNQAWAYNNLGITYRDMGQEKKAIENYNKALQIDPNYTVVYISRGNSYFALEDYDNAISNYKTALNKKPDYTLADDNLWLTYRTAQKFGDAVQYYTQRVSQDKKDGTSLYRLGESYFELKDYKNAADAYKKSLKIKKSPDVEKKLEETQQLLKSSKKK